MEISCTRKLLEFLGETPAEKSGASPLYDWHAHIITKNHRKMLVLLNDQTHLVIALFGIRAKHIKNFKLLVAEAINDTFNYYGYPNTVAVKYLQNAGDISYVKTNRSLIASMNQLTQMIKYYPNNELKEDLAQWNIINWLNKMPVKGSGHCWIFPCDEFREAVSAL